MCSPISVLIPVCRCRLIRRCGGWTTESAPATTELSEPTAALLLGTNRRWVDPELGQLGLEGRPDVNVRSFGFTEAVDLGTQVSQMLLGQYATESLVKAIAWLGNFWWRCFHSAI